MHGEKEKNDNGWSDKHRSGPERVLDEKVMGMVSSV